DIVRSAIRMKASEFAGGDMRAPSGFLASAEVKRFAVTRFEQGEDRQAALKRIGAGSGDDVLVYRSREEAAGAPGRSAANALSAVAGAWAAARSFLRSRLLTRRKSGKAARRLQPMWKWL